MAVWLSRSSARRYTACGTWPSNEPRRAAETSPPASSYNADFSFAEFVRRFPYQRGALIDCLVGDVLKDLSGFTHALAQMTSPRPIRL